MPFPFPFGAGSLERVDRLKQFEGIVQRALGRGWASPNPASTIQRTWKAWAHLLGGASLTVSRMMWNIFPQQALKEDLLPMHEAVRHIVPGTSATVEERRAELDLQLREPRNARLISIKAALEARVGVGSVTAHQHYAAALDGAGLPRLLMFVVAYAVPLPFIRTIGQVSRLDEVIKRLKPISVMGHVTRPLGGGFLTDDPDSLTDRDALED